MAYFGTAVRGREPDCLESLEGGTQGGHAQVQAVCVDLRPGRQGQLAQAVHARGGVARDAGPAQDRLGGVVVLEDGAR